MKSVRVLAKSGQKVKSVFIKYVEIRRSDAFLSSSVQNLMCDQQKTSRDFTSMCKMRLLKNMIQILIISGNVKIPVLTVIQLGQ